MSKKKEIYIGEDNNYFAFAELVHAN